MDLKWHCHGLSRPEKPITEKYHKKGLLSGDLLVYSSLNKAQDYREKKSLMILSIDVTSSYSLFCFLCLLSNDKNRNQMLGKFGEKIGFLYFCYNTKIYTHFTNLQSLLCHVNASKLRVIPRRTITNIYACLILYLSVFNRHWSFFIEVFKHKMHLQYVLQPDI